MAWVTPIGSAPKQIEYRLGQQHGCTIDDISEPAYKSELEQPLVWIGGALADLGIEAGTELTPDQFDMARALMYGRHPHTGEQLVEHKLGVPPDAKVPSTPLVRMIEALARDANGTVADVLRHTEGRWAGRTSKRMVEMFLRAQRAVQREGEAAMLRADHAGQLAGAAGLSIEDVWEVQTYTDAVKNLTKTITVTAEDGTQVEKTVDNRIVTSNLGYDVTLTVPRSLSLLAVAVDDATRAEIERIYTDKGAETFAWLEKATAYGQRGHHGDGQTAETVPGNGFAGWAMIHRAARPTEGSPVGDPHWHVHYTLANMTMADDGKWSAVASGGRDLIRHVPAAEKLLHAAARKVLSENYGITWRRSQRTGVWEVASIPDAAIKEFSQRGVDIAAMLRDLGFDENTASKALKHMVSAKTRHPKNDGATAPEATLREHYLHRAQRAGLDLEQMGREALTRRGNTTTVPPDSPPTPTLDELAQQLQNTESGLTAHGRRFSRLDAIFAVADALPNGGSQAEIETLTDRVLQHAGFVKLGHAGYSASTDPSLGEKRQLGAQHMTNSQLYTTQDIVDAEQLIVAAVEASHDDQTSIRVSPQTAEMAAETFEITNGFALSDEQRRELVNLVTSGRALDALVGGPGAGKTTLMDAARTAYHAEGFVIAGAATQGTTAQNLQAESGIPSRTVAQWLYRINQGPGLHGVDILVLDEAGMTNDRDRVKLYQAATQSGTKIVEIADPKQLRGVGCGSMFNAIHTLLEGGELVDNRRQVDADERAAIAAWRRGDYTQALTCWADRDRLVVTETGQEATSAILASWLDQRQGAPDAFTEMRGLLMVASTNEQVDRLNAGAQAIRQAQGELGLGRTYDLPGSHQVRLHENDHVMVRINQRQPGGPDALNGYRGVIDRIHDDGSVDVRWQRNSHDGPVVEQNTFTPGFVCKGGLSLGYALTIHKSQGITVGSDGGVWTGPDHQRRGGAVLFYAAGADNPGSFVAASRHKIAMWMFLARKDVESHQDEYLRGLPATPAARTRRVITKIVRRAEATEINANDRPVMVDLGLLEDPNPTTHTTRNQAAEQDSAAMKAARDAAEQAQREQVAELLREEWNGHPTAETVINGSAFGALAQNLVDAMVDGHDPAVLLADIDPGEVGSKTNPSAFTAWKIRAATGAETTDDQHRDSSGDQPPPPSDAPAGLDVLVPSYERTTARLHHAPETPPVPAPGDPDPASSASGTPLQPGPAQPPADELTRFQAAAEALHAVWEHDADWIIASQTKSVEQLGRQLDQVRQAGYDPEAFLRDALMSSGLTHVIQPNAAANTTPDPAAATTQQNVYEPGIPHPGQPGSDPARVAAALVKKHLATMPTPPPTHTAAAPPADTTPKPSSTGSPSSAGSARDAMWPSWLPPAPDPQPLSGRDRALATAAAADAARIRARAVELGRRAASERPDWVQHLGPAPDGAADRARYLAAITTLAAYREQHGITGPDPLGPPPPQPTPAYTAATQAYQRLTQATTSPAGGATNTQSAHHPVSGQPPSSPSPDEARQRAQRILDHQRRAQQQQQSHQDPRRPGPTHGPRPGM